MQLKSLVFSGTLGLATALMPAAASAQDAAGEARGTGTNAAPEIASKCKVITTAVNVAASEGVFSTSSATFSDIPEANVGFRITGTANRCVLVVFSGNPFATGNELVHVRAVLAGGTIAKPFSVQFGTNDTTFNKVATAQFQFFSVPPEPTASGCSSGPRLPDRRCSSAVPSRACSTASSADLTIIGVPALPEPSKCNGLSTGRSRKWPQCSFCQGRGRELQAIGIAARRTRGGLLLYKQAVSLPLRGAEPLTLAQAAGTLTGSFFEDLQPAARA